MDISKLRSDRVQESKVSENKNAAANSKTKGVEGSDETAANSSTAKVPSQSVENVKWSENAMLHSEGLQAAKAAPDVRSDKVAALKAAIRNGTYKVDAKGVAEKMLQSSLEDDLITRNKQ